MDKTFRTSEASNMLQYSFIAEPNCNSPGKVNEYKTSFIQNPLDLENENFKSSFRSSILEEDPDPDQDLREEFAEFEREETDLLSV